MFKVVYLGVYVYVVDVMLECVCDVVEGCVVMNCMFCKYWV